MFMRNKTGVNAPPGVNGLREDDRIPVIKVVSGDSWVVDADLIAADGGPASPKNSYVEFVLSENQFSPPIWTGEWINGVLPDENIPGLVHIRIPGEITKSLRRGSYMFSVRVSDPMKFTFSTQLKGNFLVEYMPTSDHRSIPYRDGTSEIFGGSSDAQGDGADSDVSSGTIKKLENEVNSIRESVDVLSEGLNSLSDEVSTDRDNLSDLASQVDNKVDKISGMGLSHNDYTSQDKTKVGNLKNVALTGSYNDLSNKPTIPAAQVCSDWRSSSGVSRILNKPTKLSEFNNDGNGESPFCTEASLASAFGSIEDALAAINGGIAE